MKCDQIMEQFPAYWSGDLETAARAEVQAHLAGCAACREAAEDLSAVWESLGKLPEEQPSAAARVRFDGMLAAYEQGMRQGDAGRRWRGEADGWLGRWWPRRPALQLAVALLCLGLGLGAGSRLLAGRGQSAEVAQLRQEVLSTRQLVTLSLLRQRSPSDRLQGASWGAELEHPDAEVLQALLHTLDTDPNIDVRLAVADALGRYRDEPAVRGGIIASFPRQRSPLVQIALVDILVQIDDSPARDLLRQVAADDKLNQAVRKHAAWGLKQLL